MIYFLQSLDGGPVKIGFSDDVYTRRLQLESHYGQTLSVLTTMPGGRDEETEIHARFAHLRFGRTEQFRPSPDLMAFIGLPLLIGANPDAVEVMPGKPMNGRPVRLDLPPAVHRLLRLVAADDEVSIASYARDALERLLKEEAKRRGIKS